MPSYKYPEIQIPVHQVPTDQPDPVFRYTRTTFADAGMDNYAQPPSQDPEMMMNLNNIQPIVDGSLKRRWGYQKWAAPGAVPVNEEFDFQTDTSQQRQLILTSAGTSPGFSNGFVRAQNDDGSNFNTSLFTPTSGQPAVRCAVSRSYAYMTNGQDYKVWNGAASGGVHNWGISSGSQTGLVLGPNAPGTATDTGGSGGSGSQGALGPNTGAQDSSQAGLNDDGSTPTFVNPSNVTIAGQGSGGTQEQFEVGGIGNNLPVGSSLTATNFGFAIPGTATVVGIQLDVLWFANIFGANPSSCVAQDGKIWNALGKDGIYLCAAGSSNYLNAVGTDHSTGINIPGSFAFTSYGGSSDTWSAGLGPTDVNNSAFGAIITPAASTSDFTSGDAVQVNVGYCQITVWYTVPSTTSWTNPNNIKANDGAVATATVSTSYTSGLNATNFGFSVPGGDSITGIQVDVKCDSSGATPNLVLQLLKGGVLTGALKALTVTISTLGFITYGGQGDLWSGTFAAADANASNFGFQMKAITTGGSGTLNIDFVRITLYLESGAIIVGSPSSGGGTAVTLNVGRTYYASFSNPLNGNFSDITIPSASSGPCTNQSIPLSGIPVSMDSQVSFVNILSTADGNDSTTLYLLAQLANGTTTYTDNTPETQLLAQPILLSTDTSGTEHGVTNNDPPPTGGTLPIAHRGNMYLVKNGTLYWSKSLDDVTTASSFIAGRWEEDWPSLNQFDIAATAENVRGLLSDGVNLYIGTEYKIRRLNGSAPYEEPPDIVHNEVGILNQDVWEITFIQGTPAGAIWMTPDARVIQSDFNTYQDIGVPIQTVLNTTNLQAAAGATGSSTYNFGGGAKASFYANNAFDLYVLAIPTGTNTQADTICVYNLRSSTWVVWNLADLITAIEFNITINGTSQLVFGTSTGVLYNMAPGLTQDRIGNTPVNIVATAQTNWLDLKDPALRKILNEIEVQTADAGLTVLVEGASKMPDFVNPNTVKSGTVVLSPRGEYKLYLASAISKDRYYRFTFTSNSQVQNVLGGFNVEVVPVNRQ